MAQTFVVGMSGDLIGIDVAAYAGFGSSSTTLFIVGTSGQTVNPVGATSGVPDLSQVLASVPISIPFASQGDASANYFQPTIWFSPISVSIGEQLAIVLYNNAEGVNWKDVGWPTPDYLGGTAFQGYASDVPLNQFTNLDADARFPGLDLGFRTYIDTKVPDSTPVPEPASLLLLGTGLLAVVAPQFSKRN